MDDKRVRGPRGIAASASAQAACVATETAFPARGVVVRGPPPEPITEPPPQASAPSPASVWVAGYWHWTGMQYTWIPGHWENAPPGTAWAAPRYTSADGAYYYEAGAWKPVRPSANALH